MRTQPARWTSTPYEVGAALRLRDALGVSPTVATVLTRRGLADPDEARRFLAAEERHDPTLLPGVPEAVELIRAHVERGSPITVHGDYDVDGVSSTAILLRMLRALGAEPRWELPSRFGDGYGLSKAAVERLAAKGVGLLIAVDCGITAVDEIAAARAAGMDVLVVDHHQPLRAPDAGDAVDSPPILPDCVIVHPALGDYPCPAMCAAGVALKLSEALLGRVADEDLELAALGTVCDLVPLRDENRRIVREGVAALARTRQPGLRALMAVGGLEPGDVDERAIGFRLGPRLNAAGRMRRADAALELLMTTDEARAEEVARELDFLNRDRQEAELRIVSAADALCVVQASQGAIVVAGEDWHPGVVGIVASRLVERWRRPAVVISIDGDRARGSGRSISGYDLHGGLAACAEHLTRFGGHKMAAGVELDAASVDAFRAALAAHAGALLAPEDLIGEERVDAVVPGGALGLGLAEELEQLRPFGMGNPQPTLLVPAARIEGVAGMGDERQHSRFTLVTGASRARGVAFGSPATSLAPARAEPHDVAVRLERNRWKGVVEPRVVLRALCPTRTGELLVLGPERPFWDALDAEHARQQGSLVPLNAAPFELVDRRGEGFAGVVGELLTSGSSVLVCVADVPRRREGLERVVAGLAGEVLAVVDWQTLADDPALAAGFDDLVAFDPPPGGHNDALLAVCPRGHLAWGPAEVEFALSVWGAELDLRPALAEAYRALRELGPDAALDAQEAALRGEARYPRSAACCGRLVRVLGELGFVAYDAAGPRLTLLDAPRTDVEKSPSYRAYREGLARSTALLAPAPAAPARAA